MAVTLTIDGVAATGYNLPDYVAGTTFPGLAFAGFTFNGSTVITGAKIEMNVGGNILSTETGEIAITDGVYGNFQIIKQKFAFPVRRYIYRLTITFANGDVKVILEGIWNVTE
jgi:hypothetical protein